MSEAERDHLLVKGIFRGADAAFWVSFHELQGSAGLPHDHDFSEIALIGGGSGRHISIFGDDELRQGDCLVLTPGAWHDYQRCEALQVANCCFRPSIVLRELGAILNDNALMGLLDFSHGASPARLRFDASSLNCALGHLRTMESLQWRAETAARLELRAHFLSLLGLISRSMTAGERHKWAAAAAWPAAVRDSVLRIENQLERDWSIVELARAAHLAPAYFVRLFRKSVGEPPLHYLARRRAETAAALLLSTSLPVNDIAARVGWHTPAHFSRRFRAHFGMSANEYRRARGGGQT